MSKVVVELALYPILYRTIRQSPTSPLDLVRLTMRRKGYPMIPAFATVWNMSENDF